MFDQRCFSDISSVRNEFAHPDGQTTNVPWVEKALSRLAKAARVGALECFDDIQRLTASIQELKSGTSAPPGKAEVALVEEEFEAAQKWSSGLWVVAKEIKSFSRKNRFTDQDYVD